MFRHALAQALVDVAGLKVAQEMLGHAHISTTADTYSHVDEQAMVAAVERVHGTCSICAPRRSPATAPPAGTCFRMTPQRWPSSTRPRTAGWARSHGGELAVRVP